MSLSCLGLFLGTNSLLGLLEVPSNNSCGGSLFGPKGPIAAAHVSLVMSSIPIF
jgi:hypothetical protein